MTSATPVVDPVLWGRFLLGAILVLWLPGHVWLTRHWRHTAWPVRIAAAMAAGMLLASGFASAASFVGAPVTPWLHVPAVLALGAALGRMPSFARAMRELDPSIEGASAWVAASACGIAMAAFLVGFADFAAPPHVHDASNHAFLTWRVAQTESVRPDALFADPYGRPGLPYLVGWHAGAALVARTVGVAPYLSTWLLAATALGLLPLALVMLWRSWQLPAPAWSAAACLAVASRHAPAGVLTWGGFGVVAGMFLTPLVTLLLTRCLRTRSLWIAALAGLALGTLAHVHGSETAVVLGLVLLSWTLDPVRPRLTAVEGIVLLAGAVVALGPSVLGSATGSYLEGGMAAVPATALGTLVERYLKSGGTQPHSMLLWAAALVFALTRPRWRRLAVASLALGGLAAALGTFHDPVSRALTTPFYREPWRVQYVQLFLAPALMGLAAADTLRWLRPRVQTVALPFGLAAAFVLPPQADIVRIYRDTNRLVPFTRADYDHARAMPSVVGTEEWVANDPDDGSTWAMHVSGCRFLRPSSWDLRDSSGTWTSARTTALLEDPWPEDALDLRERNVRYVYASDTRYGGSRFERARLDADHRFEPVLVGETSTLYRIRW